MKVLVLDNMHLVRGNDGKYYAPSIYNHEFFNRYLNSFETVKIVGKVKESNSEDIKEYNLVSGQGMEIIALPWYQGIKGFILCLPKLIKIFSHICDDVDCCIFRIAQIESFMGYILGKHRPFAVEVVNDPETFTDINPLMRKCFVHMTKKMCRKANGVSYVTKDFLQKKYPSMARKKGESDFNFESYYSSIYLRKEDIFEKVIRYDKEKVFTIIHVANSINNNLKGHETLINAISEVIKNKYNIKAIFIGDGTKKKDYEDLVRLLGLKKYIKFIGRISKKTEVLQYLRNSNLMVLPTQMEGLPRTIIEAMAVGLPCISTPIAGIPELIDEKYLFNPQDYNSFAKEIIRLIENPNELEYMSAQNLQKVKEYSNEVLEPRRTEFYNKLRKIVECRNNS